MESKLYSHIKEVRGRARELAVHVNVSESRVSEWASGKRKVPPIHCIAIEDFFKMYYNGKINRVDLRPDDWKKYWPEFTNTEHFYKTKESCYER